MADDEAVLRDDGTIELHDAFDDELRGRWTDVDEFAAAYDLEQKVWNDTSELGPATEFLMSLAREAPPWAVDFLRELVARVRSETLVDVGCGPLEDLARHDAHDPGLNEAIATAARELPAFQKALSNVWLGEDLPSPLRARLSTLGARDFVDEQAMNETERAAYVEYRNSQGWEWG